MQLTVIIVNYNVKYFLEQVLLSVERAAAGLEVETIVVDNNSKDGSVAFVQEHFDWVTLIANTDNTGFAVANNQAMKIAKGKYVLLLNPDTVVGEDTFRTVIDFMDAHPDAGGLGIKMVDGKGQFLPESKRGLPTPWVSFCKMSGLGTLFPNSKRFNYYYLGHLSEKEIQKVEILSGAFMLMRKTALDKVGLLDESFFMYGEDIDLSYRIIQGGYQNYYFPHHPIIHYKGESTKKGSLNYVKVFYQAMVIFAKKHFTGSGAKLYISAIQIAIFLKATLTLVTRFIQKFATPALDALLIFGGMYWLKTFWETNIKVAEGLTYGIEYLFINLPLYISIWLISIFFSGGYDRPIRLPRINRGILIGTVLISAVYGFLPESLRFSRSMILLGAIWAIFALNGWRMIRHFLKHRTFRMDLPENKRAMIIGSKTESQRVENLLFQAGAELEVVAYIDPKNQVNTNYTPSPKYTAPISQLPSLIKVLEISELIFCAKDMLNKDIIQYLQLLDNRLAFKIVPEGSNSIIGSNSKNTAGDLYAIDTHYNISIPRHRRNKRVFDSLLCLLLLPILPLLYFLVQPMGSFIKSWWQVLSGQYSWIGYVPTNPNRALPQIRPGIWNPLNLKLSQLNEEDQDLYHQINYLYAKDYEVGEDWKIVWQQFKK